MSQGEGQSTTRVEAATRSDSEQHVRVEIDEQIGWITLDRPAARNAINDIVLEQLAAAVDRLDADPAVKVMVLAGAGPCFSAGVDLGWLAAGVTQKLDVGADDGVRLRRFIDWIQTTIGRFEASEKPSIAMIHGFCGGLGFEIALACDLRLAAPNARLGLPEVVLGIVPDCGGTTRLTRIAGPARAKQLIMTGEMISAEQAERYDIVHEVSPEGQLRERCTALARSLCARPAAAVGLAKRLIDLGTGLDSRRFMQLEALTQTILLGSPNLGQRVAMGMQTLKKRP